MKPRDRKKLTLKEFLYKYRHFSLVSCMVLPKFSFNTVSEPYSQNTICIHLWIITSLSSNILLYHTFSGSFTWALDLYTLAWYQKDYFRLCIYMFGGMYLCYILYLIFPNGQR